MAWLICCALAMPAMAQEPDIDAQAVAPAPAPVVAPAAAPAAPVAPAEGVVPPAEVPAAPAEAPVAPVEGAVAKNVVPGAHVAVAEGGADLISVTLDDVALPDVVRLFTRLSGANIVAATTNLKGSVTANLQNVKWRPAFESILERQNLLLVERPPESGIFVVEPRPVGTPDPRVAESYRLSYVRVDEAAKVVQNVLGKEGTVTPFPAGNALIVHASASKQAEAKRVIVAMDTPREQVYIEAKIVELAGDASKKLGIDWSMLDGYRMGVGGSVDSDGNLAPLTRTYKSTRVTEDGSGHYKGSERSETWDANGRPVRESDEALPISDPTDVGSGATTAAGAIDGIGGVVEGNGVGGAFVNAKSAVPGALAVESWNVADGVWNAVTDTRTAVFNADALQVVLSALQTSDDTSVISNPKIIVANEEKATIDMSTKEPYVVVQRKLGTVDSPGDEISTELSTIPGKNEPFVGEAFFSYGIKVDVTPRVNTASNITVTIEPTLSDLVRYADTPGDTTYPIIQSKRVRTVFSLADGRTAAIGGLITTSDALIVKKIPLLGDIPLIGKYLFSHTSKTKRQRETVIFVTVGIVKSDQPELGVPEGSKLVQKHIDADGHIIGGTRAVEVAMAKEAAAASAATAPAAAEPVAAEPVAVEPVAAEPAAAEPVATP